MSVETRIIDVIEPDDKWLYRVGGVSALLIGIGYIAILPLFAHVGVPPTGGEVWLKYLHGKTTVWWIILALSVLTDFLFVPVGLSLYVALKRLNKSAMLLASAFVGIFVVLDLSVTWTNYASLLILSDLYASATTEVQRASYVAAANYASAVLASRTEVFYAVVDLSLGILIISLIMLKSKGHFGKATAYIGLAAGVSGIASATGVFAIILVNALLTTIWMLFVGFRLFRVGQGGSGQLLPAAVAD